MAVDEAQAQIRQAFVGGGPGAVVSGIVWLAAAMVLQRSGIKPAFAALFFGGMVIFPLASLICRIGFGRSASVKGNPLGLVALESTIAMIAGLVGAWLLLAAQPDAVFPVAALAVGTHYFAFKTAYGDRTFWVLGALLTMLGCVGLFWLPGRNLALMVTFAGAEIGFGLWLTAGHASSPTAK